MTFRRLSPEEQSRLEAASIGPVPDLEALVLETNNNAGQIATDPTITTAEVDEIAYTLGVGLGRLLIARLPELEWAVLSDNYGTDLVVYSPSNTDLYAAPVQVMRQRLEPDDEDSTPAGTALVQFVERFTAQ